MHNIKFHSVTMSARKQEHIRATILTGLRAGRTKKEIVEFHNLPEATVRRIKNDFDKFVAEGGKEEEFSVMRKKHKRRSDAHDDIMINQVQELINQDLGRSMRKIARDLGVRDHLIREI